MKNLETGKDKIQKICDALRIETLEPAKQEAREIVENAHIEAQEVFRVAKKRAEEILQAAEQEIEEKKKVFQASLKMSCRQGIEWLKQSIEKEIFSKELCNLVLKEIGDANAIAAILQSFMKTMEEKGIDDDFIFVIPKSITPRTISSLLGNQVLDRLKKKAIEVGDFSGGVQIQLKGRQITIDISDRVVRELIAHYIRRDFRDLIFSV